MVYEWGSPYAPPIFCVHGLTRNGRDFDHLARALSGHYRVICIDMAGRGKSERLAQAAWYTNATYMHDILNVAERMNLAKFDWIGTSMGGMIGMMIAALEPGRITRLVLNDVGATLSAEGLRRICDYVGRTCDFPDIDTAQQTVRRLMQSFAITDDAHWAHVFEHSFIHHENGKVTLAYDPAIGDAFRLAVEEAGGIQEISLWMLWEAIDIPTQIIRGMESDILPRDVAVKMCETHPDASLVEFEGIGHAPTLMEDAQISAIADWLEENPLKGV